MSWFNIIYAGVWLGICLIFPPLVVAIIFFLGWEMPPMILVYAVIRFTTLLALVCSLIAGFSMSKHETNNKYRFK